MDGLIERDEVITRYLLGELPEAERVRIQERLFNNDEYFDQMLEAENDLVDRYARGELDDRDRELFERSILQRDAVDKRVEFARALAAVAGKQSASSVASFRRRAPRSSWDRRRGMWLWLAAASFLVVIGSMWLIRRAVGPRGEIAKLPAAEQQPPESATPNAEQPAPPNKPWAQRERSEPRPKASGNQHPPKGQLPGPMVHAALSFVLSSGSTRDSGQLQKIVIGREDSMVRLLVQLDEGDEYMRYGIVLRTAGGDEVWKRSGLRSRRMGFGRVVTAELSATTLHTGEYELELDGLAHAANPAAIDYYYFNVEKPF